MTDLNQGHDPKAHGSGRRLHLQALRRRLVPERIAVRRSNLPDRVVMWLFPWTVTTYPGQHRGVLGVLGRRITWDTVRHWLHDRRPVPAWAAEVLADYIEARCRAGLELAAELRALPVRPDKRRAGNRVSDNEGPGDGR